MLSRLLLTLALMGASLAQQEVSYTDASGIPFHGIYDSAVDFHLGFLFPTSTTGTEFIGEFIVPISQQWAGISLGGGQPNNPLIMSWPYNGQIVFTTRFSTYVSFSTESEGREVMFAP
jgi:cellobiose dehydrogenase (acceptor)